MKARCKHMSFTIQDMIKTGSLLEMNLFAFSWDDVWLCFFCVSSQLLLIRFLRARFPNR